MKMEVGGNGNGNGSGTVEEEIGYVHRVRTVKLCAYYRVGLCHVCMYVSGGGYAIWLIG